MEDDKELYTDLEGEEYTTSQTVLVSPWPWEADSKFGCCC